MSAVKTFQDMRNQCTFNNSKQGANAIRLEKLKIPKSTMTFSLRFKYKKNES